MRPIAQAVREMLAEEPQDSRPVAISCSGKERFETFGMAQRVARRITRKYERMSVYRCRVCGGFHIGGAR